MLPYFNHFRTPYVDDMILDPDIHQMFIDLDELEDILITRLGFHDKIINGLETVYIHNNFELKIWFNENMSYNKVKLSENNKNRFTSWCNSNKDFDFYDIIKSTLRSLAIDKDKFFKCLKRKKYIEKLLNDN